MHERAAKRLLRLAEYNGGVYIKLGQHISSLVYLVPDEYVQILSKLHDRCPKSSMSALDTMTIKEVGQSMGALFPNLQTEPLGVASLAQVHRSNSLAIKFQHPHMEVHAEQDIKMVDRMVNYIKFTFPKFNLAWLSEEMKRNLPKEMDFREEAHNAEQLREHFFGYKYTVPTSPNETSVKVIGQQLTTYGSVHKILKIPRMYWATKRILCMEYINGGKVDDFSYMKEHNIHPHQVARALAYLYGNQIFLHGFMHSDPHKGNIMILARPYRGIFHRFWNMLNGIPNFQLVLLDHGLYRSLSFDFRTSYAYLWKSLAEGNEEEIKKWSLIVGNGVSSYKLFSSMISGRSWDVIKEGELTAGRSEREKQAVARANQYIEGIADILATVPRDLLLVLKTNDLIRSIDYSLGCSPFISYLSQMRMVNNAIYLKEQRLTTYVLRDMQFRMLDYGLGFYYRVTDLFYK